MHSPSYLQVPNVPQMPISTGQTTAAPLKHPGVRPIANTQGEKGIS